MRRRRRLELALYLAIEERMNYDFMAASVGVWTFIAIAWHACSYDEFPEGGINLAHRKLSSA
jgi:hypothetical protein